MHLCDFSIIRPTVGCGVFVNPVLFNVRHAIPAKYFARCTGAVKGAAFRAVTEGLEPVTFLGWVPLIHNEFNGHTATPDAGYAFYIVGPGVKTPVAAFSVGFQVGGYAKEWLKFMVVILVF